VIFLLTRAPGNPFKPAERREGGSKGGRREREREEEEQGEREGGEREYERVERE
jgi:hypothetical protein